MRGKKILNFNTIAISFTVLVLASFTFAIPVSAVPPINTSPSCGDTITTNTKLVSDLTCTTTPGLIIGADNIQLNLNGFTLTGTACASCHGIRNVGFDNITIKDGVVVGFEQGIRAEGGDGFTIKNVIVRGQTSSSAIDLLDNDNVVIKDVSISITVVSNAIEAIRLESVANVEVKNVDVDGGAVGVNFACFPCPDPNGPTNGVIKDSTFVNNGNAIFLPATTDAKVKNNVITGASSSAILVGLKCFVGSFPAVTNVVITGNVVSNNAAAGITLCKADNSKVEKNLVTGNGGNGIRLLDSDNNEIEKNIATGNTGDDMKQDSASSSNTWEKNTCVTKDDTGSASIDCP